MKFSNQESLFNIPAGVTYINCAYMSPGLKSVNEAGIAAIHQRAEPWGIQVKDWFEPAEELKALFATIINSDKQNIALVPSVSYGISIAKNNITLTADQEIVVLDQQYPSNIYAWMELSKETGARIVTVNKKESENWTEAILKSITINTGLVAIPNCHWTNGGLIDLKTISKRTKETGARLVIDASQSAGVYPLDIQSIKPDFLVTAGYKWLLGPYGLAYFYADDKYFENGNPIEYTWINRAGSENFTRLVDYTETYKAGAGRFDAGGYSAFINIPMAKAALTQILKWGVGNIQETIADLTDRVSRSAKERGHKIADETRVGHILGIKLEESKISEIANVLTDNKIYVSFRGNSMRIAPYLYNDNNDIDKLFKFL